MIDFKKMLKERGVGGILHVELPSIKAKISSGYGEKSELIDTALHFELRKAFNSEEKPEWWLHLFGGPTGFESARVTDLLSRDPSESWIANMGSSRYRRLEISIGDIIKAMKEYTVVHRFEVL